jgi:hypothetical protein
VGRDSNQYLDRQDIYCNFRLIVVCLFIVVYISSTTNILVLRRQTWEEVLHYYRQCPQYRHDHAYTTWVVKWLGMRLLNRQLRGLVCVCVWVCVCVCVCVCLGGASSTPLPLSYYKVSNFCVSVYLCVCVSGYTFPQFSTDLLQVWMKTFYGSSHVPWAI